MNCYIPATRFKNAHDALTRFDAERFVWLKGHGHKNDALKRAHLIAALFRARVIAFGEEPKINNRGFPRTPFVQFAHMILGHDGIGKLDMHLEAYQAYRKRTLQSIPVAIKWGVFLLIWALLTLIFLSIVKTHLHSFRKELICKMGTLL